jgi:hypothetical protein
MDTEKHKRIEERAYAFWEAEGQPHGRHDEHWQRAVLQIDAEEAACNGAKSKGRRPKKAAPTPERNAKPASKKSKK